MTAPLTPRERVRRLFIKLDKDDECDWSAIVQFKKLSDQLAAELEESQKKCDQLTGMKFSDRMHAALVSRAEAAERQLVRYREAEKALPVEPPIDRRVRQELTVYIDALRAHAVAVTAERQLAATQPNNPCTCAPDGDDGSVAHLCEWHKQQFGKAYRMQNVADSLTVGNILKLPQDALRRWIAHGIQESSARKKAEEQLARYREKYGELE